MKISAYRLRSPPWCPPQRGGAIMLAGGCTRPFAGAPPHPFLAPVARVFGRRLRRSRLPRSVCRAPRFGRPVVCSVLVLCLCLFVLYSVSGFVLSVSLQKSSKETMPPSVPRRGKRWVLGEGRRLEKEAALPSPNYLAAKFVAAV